MAASQLGGTEVPVGYRLVRGEPALGELAELSVERRPPGPRLHRGRAGRQTNPAEVARAGTRKAGRH